ncbi:hypothetical protein [Streptomyces sioyaensis]
MTLKESLKHAGTVRGGGEDDDDGGGNPSTGDSDDGRDYLH